MQKNSTFTFFILLWHQNWSRNYLKCPINLGKKFVKNIYHCKGVKPNTYSLSVVSESKDLKYLNALSVNKATRLHGIPSHFVRGIAPIIVCPLTHIINLSIIQCVVNHKLLLYADESAIFVADKNVLGLCFRKNWRW